MYLPKVIFLIYIIYLTSYSQDSDVNLKDKSYFLSFSYGYQMSGIKDEDFVSSNFSSLYNINFGTWFSELWGIQIGYKGYFFKYIMDNYKHFYNFYFFEGFVSLNELLNFKESDSWDLLLHTGPGYFYNHSYKKSNICINTGITSVFNIINSFYVSLSISSIAGWDIYQGNWDILPGFSVGMMSSF